MKPKNLLVVLVCMALLATPIVFAASVTTTTQVNFNIGQVVQFTLTLPGQSGVAATGGGAATANVDFNSTDGTDTELQAKVGGSTQDDSNPVFVYDNTGTVNLNLTVKLNASTPACIDLYGGTTNTTITTELGTSETSITTDFTPADPTVDYFLKTNFTSCVAGDSTTRLLTSNGTQTT